MAEQSQEESTKDDREEGEIIEDSSDEISCDELNSNKNRVVSNKKRMLRQSYNRGSDIPVHVHSLVYKRAGKHSAKLRPIIDSNSKEADPQMFGNSIYFHSGARFFENLESPFSLMNFNPAIGQCQQELDNIHEKENRSGSETDKRGRKHKHHSYEDYSIHPSSSASHEKHSPSFVSHPKHSSSSSSHWKHPPSFTSHHKHSNSSMPHQRHSPTNSSMPHQRHSPTFSSHKHSFSHRKHLPSVTSSEEQSDLLTKDKAVGKNKSERKRRISLRKARVTRKTKRKPRTYDDMRREIVTHCITKNNYLRSLKTRIENMLNPLNEPDDVIKANKQIQAKSDPDVIDITDEVIVVEPSVEIIDLDSPEEDSEPKATENHSESKTNNNDIETIVESAVKCEDDQIENVDETERKYDDHLTENNPKESENTITSSSERNKTAQDDEELQLRLLALRSAILKKHSKRSKTAKSNHTNNEDESNSIQSPQVLEVQSDIVTPVDMEIAESEDESEKSVKIIEESIKNINNSGPYSVENCSLPRSSECISSTSEHWTDQQLMSYETGKISSENNSFINDSHQIPTNNFAYNQFFAPNDNFNSGQNDTFFAAGNEEIRHGCDISYNSHANNITDSSYNFIDNRDTYAYDNTVSNNNSSTSHATNYFSGIDCKSEEHSHQKYSSEQNYLEEYGHKWSQFYAFDTYPVTGTENRKTVYNSAEECFSVTSMNLHDTEMSSKRPDMKSNTNSWNSVERERTFMKSNLPKNAPYINKANVNRLRNESFQNFRKRKDSSNNLAIWNSKKAKLQSISTLSRTKRIVNSTLKTKLQNKYKNQRVIPKAHISVGQKVENQILNVRREERSNKNPFSLKVTVPTKKRVLNDATSDQGTGKRFVICLKNESESEEDEGTSVLCDTEEAQNSPSNIQLCSEEKTTNITTHSPVSFDLEKSVDSFLKELREREEQAANSSKNSLIFNKKVLSNHNASQESGATVSNSLLSLPPSQQEEYRRLREQLHKLEKENLSRRQQLVARSPQKHNVNRYTSTVVKKTQSPGKGVSVIFKDFPKAGEPRSEGNKKTVSCVSKDNRLPPVVAATSTTRSVTSNKEVSRLEENPAIVSKDIPNTSVNHNSSVPPLGKVRNSSNANDLKIQNRSHERQVKCITSDNIPKTPQTIVVSKDFLESYKKSHKQSATKNLVQTKNIINSSNSIMGNRILNRKTTASAEKVVKCNTSFVDDSPSVKNGEKILHRKSSSKTENRQSKNTSQEIGNEQTVDLSDCEMELLNKRYKALDEITKALDSFRYLEDEQKTEEKLNADVVRLREELAAAETRLLNQNKVVKNIRSDLPTVAFRVKECTSSCFALTKKCLLFGIKSRGKHYKVPSTGAELLKSKLQHLQQCLKRLKPTEDGKSQKDTGERNVDSVKAESNYLTDSDGTLESRQKDSQLDDCTSHKINVILPTDTTDLNKSNDIKENTLLKQVNRLNDLENVIQETDDYNNSNEMIMQEPLSIENVLDQNCTDNMIIEPNITDKTSSKTVTVSACDDKMINQVTSLISEMCTNDKVMENTVDSNHCNEVMIPALASETASQNIETDDSDNIIPEPDITSRKTDIVRDCVFDCESVAVSEIENQNVADQSYCDEMSGLNVSEDSENVTTEPIIISNLTASKNIAYSKYVSETGKCHDKNIPVITEKNKSNDTKHNENEETVTNEFELEEIEDMAVEESLVEGKYESDSSDELMIDELNENDSGVMSESDLRNDFEIECIHQLHDEETMLQADTNKIVSEIKTVDRMLLESLVIAEDSVKSNINRMLSECIENNDVIGMAESDISKAKQIPKSIQMNNYSNDCENRVLESCTVIDQNTAQSNVCNDNVPNKTEVELKNLLCTAVLNGTSNVELSSQPVPVSTDNLLSSQADITPSVKDSECETAVEPYDVKKSLLIKNKIFDGDVKDGSCNLPQNDLTAQYSDNSTCENNSVSDASTSGKGCGQIDLHLPICPFDLMGSCYDENCKFQHLEWPSDSE